MLLTFRGYMSVEGLGLGNVHFMIYIYVFVLDICGQHLGDIYMSVEFIHCIGYMVPTFG